MTGFDEWLKETKVTMSTIVANAATLNTELKQLIVDSKATLTQSGEYFTEVKKQSSVTGYYFDSNEDLRLGLLHLAAKGHDGEILISLDYFLGVNHIDLSGILATPISSDQITIQQNGPATLKMSSSGCSIVNNGYLGIVIPTKISAFGQEKIVDLVITTYINHDDVFSYMLNIDTSTSLQLCPETSFATEQRVRFLNLAQAKVDAEIRRMGYNTGELSLGIRPPILYGSFLTEKFLRIFFSYGYRRRRNYPLYPAVDTGYDTVLKVGKEFITDAIASEIARNGLHIRGELQSTGPTSFNIRLGYTYETEVQIGCVTITFRAVVEGTLSAELGVVGRNKVVIKLKKVSDPAIVEMTGDWIPGLSMTVEALINMVIGRVNLTLNFSQEFEIDIGQQSLALELTAQNLILKFKMI